MKEENKITKEEAKKVIAFDKDGMAHTFSNPGGMLIGADHSKKSLFKDIDKSFMCGIAGESALGMGHGLAIIPKEEGYQSDILFVETKDSFNKKYKKD